MVLNPKFKPTIEVINNRLTDEQLSSILATDTKELGNSPIKKTIKFLANSLKVDSADALKAAIAEKIRNRENYNSDENQEAKATGRMDYFKSNFNI